MWLERVYNTKPRMTDEYSSSHKRRYGRPGAMTLGGLCLTLTAVLAITALTIGIVNSVNISKHKSDTGSAAAVVAAEARVNDALAALRASEANDRGQLAAELAALRDGLAGAGQPDEAVVRHLASLEAKTSAVQGLYKNLAASVEELGKNKGGKPKPPHHADDDDDDSSSSSSSSSSTSYKKTPKPTAAPHTPMPTATPAPTLPPGPIQGCVDAEKFTGYWRSFNQVHLFAWQWRNDGAFYDILYITVQECNSSGFILDAETLVGSPSYPRKPQPSDARLRFTLPFSGKDNYAFALGATVENPISAAYVAETAADIRIAMVYQSNASGVPGSIVLSQTGRLQTGDAYNTFLFNWIFEKISQPLVVRNPFNDGSLQSTNDFRFQFDQLTTYMKEMYKCLSDSPRIEGYAGFANFIQETGKVRNVGIDIPETRIINALKSTLLSTSTVLHVKYWSPVNIASDITITGFLAEWGALNGVRLCIPYLRAQDIENAALNDVFFPADRSYQRILIQFDSSSFPDYDPDLHGKPSFTARIGPVTSDMSYREFVEAVIYVSMLQNQMGSTHSSIEYFSLRVLSLLQNPIVETKEGVESLLAQFSFLSGAIRHQTLFRAQIGSSQLVQFAKTNAAVVINEPFTELGRSATTPLAGLQGTIPGNFNQIFNYVQNVSYLWYRAVPGSPVVSAVHAAFPRYANLTNNENAFVAATHAGLIPADEPEGASRFEGKIGPSWLTGNGNNPVTGKPDIHDENGDFGFYSPFVNVLAGGVAGSIQTQYVGIINPSLVNNAKIGYLRLGHTRLRETAGITVNTDHFGGRGYQPLSDILCAMTKWFNDFPFPDGTFGVDAIIMDMRVNAGGDTIVHLNNCFGKRRINTYIPSIPIPNQPTRPVIVDEDIEMLVRENFTSELFISSRTQPFLQEHRPDLIEQEHPGSVFLDGPIISLTSVNAYSGGDQVPNFFLGENADGNLGSLEEGKNVRHFVVGNMHGLFTGLSSTPVYAPDQSEQSPFIYSSLSKTAVPPVFFLPETFGMGIPTRLDKNGIPFPGLVPVMSMLPNSPLYNVSLSGGSPIPGLGQRPLASAVEYVSYYDYGYQGPGPREPELPRYSDGHWDSVANGGPTGLQTVYLADGVTLFPDQPERNASRPETWRDSWLEEAIRVAQIAAYGNYITNVPPPAPLSQRSRRPESAASFRQRYAEQHFTSAFSTLLSEYAEAHGLDVHMPFRDTDKSESEISAILESLSEQAKATTERWVSSGN